MAQTTSEVWDTRWSASRRAVRPEVVDNAFEKYGVLSAFRKKNLMMTDSGGKEITVFLESSTGDVQAFDKLDNLSKTQSDPIEAAHFKRRYYAAPIVISSTEEWENSGATQVFNHLNALGDNAFNSILKGVNEDLCGLSSGKRMLGLQDVIADDPTSDSVGGIATGSAFWRNQYDITTKTFLTQTVTNIFDGIDLMNDMLDSCAQQGASKFNIMTTYPVARAYRVALSSQGYGEINIVKGGGIGGPVLPSFYGNEMIADADISASTLYFVETEANKLNVLRQANFKKTDFVSLQSNGQLGQIAYMVAGVQYTTNNRRRSGVLTDLTGT